MADNSGTTYTIKAGDTITLIARENNIADWEIIFGHDNNKQYRDANPDYDKLKTGEKIFIPPADLNIALQSGPQQAAVMPGNALFFDAHMHIQSNNCAPLPLQWAVMKKNAALRLQTGRSTVNLSAGIATGRFGKIGAYSSDKIAIIYAGRGEKQKDRDSIYWKIYECTLPGAAVETAKDVKHYFDELFQTDKGLGLLTGSTDDDYEVNFKEAAQFYFKNNRLERMAVCLLMDMSYSHYWGKFGIPINMPCGNSIAFINDFISAGVVYNSGNIFADFTSLTEKPVFEIPMPGWSHLYSKKLPGDQFSFKEQYSRFIQPKLRDPALPDMPEKGSFIAFSNDPDENAVNSRLITRNFIHIIEDLPKSETRKFEDYSKQRLRSIKAAMTFPLQLIPFYHYDPRRHIGKDTRASLLDELTKNHAFYRLSGRSFAQKIFDYSSKYVKLTPDKDLNKPEYFTKLLGALSDNGSAFENLFFHGSSTKGVFWGVKMYPRLGFAPEDFQEYPHLKEFYSACQNNKIPITTHCSRGGMFIADYVNNVRYGPSAPNPPDSASQDSIEYIQSEYWFADNFAAPANWETVLKNYPQLKLDLAHFGGGDIWRWVGSFEDIESNFPSDPAKLPKGEKPEGADNVKKAQMASMYFAWVRKVAELCDTYANVYTDLSYFLNPAPSTGGSDFITETNKGQSTVTVLPLDKIAKNIVYLVNKYPNLKNKIMVGSDWLMIEYDGLTGVGTYFKRMFDMLRRASIYLKFDAWHQFAVINPLKFMGLWKEPGKVDVDFCRKYVERLQMWVKDKEILTQLKTLPPIANIKSSGEAFVNHLKDIPKIKDSKEINNEKKQLIILGG